MKAERRTLYTYNAQNRTFAIHESNLDLFLQLPLDNTLNSRHGTSRNGQSKPPHVYLSDLHGFGDPFTGNLVILRQDISCISFSFYFFPSSFWISKTNPSSGIRPITRSWPTIVFKIGYAETENDLISDDDLILEGSEGRTGYVIVVNLRELQPSDQRFKRAMWNSISTMKILGNESGLEKDKYVFL